MATKSGWFKVLPDGKEQELYHKVRETQPPSKTPAEKKEGGAGGGPERKG